MAQIARGIAARGPELTVRSGTDVRSLAIWDTDRDGDLDILITNNHGPARLLRNDGGNRRQWITIRTVGS